MPIKQHQITSNFKFQINIFYTFYIGLYPATSVQTLLQVSLIKISNEGTATGLIHAY